MRLRNALAIGCMTVGLATLTDRAATATTINFDSFADSTVLTTQVVGVTFGNAVILSAGVSLNEFEFPPHSGNNVAFDDGGPISIDFTTPETTVSAYFTYGSALTVNAYDAANALLATVTSAFPTNIVSSGNTPNEFLSVSGAAITRVTITGDASGSSFVMDDLSFIADDSSTAIPAPGGWLLLSAGVLTVLGLRRGWPAAVSGAASSP